MKIPIEKFEAYLENKNLKDRTIENYAYYFTKFNHDFFNQESVSRFILDKSNRNSIARSFLINFQKFLKIHYKEFNFSEEQRVQVSEVELPKITGRVKQRLIKPLSYEQIQLLEKFLDTEELKLKLVINYFCALRLGELMKIRLMSFNWDEWKKDTSKMGECMVLGKGDKEGIALMPSHLMIRISRFIRNNTFESVNSRLFPNSAKVRNMGRTWQTKLREAGLKSGLTKLDEKGEPIKETSIHPHRLRHAYASYLINVKKMDIRDVQEILRHSSITSTQIYTHIDKERLKKELSQN